MRNSKHSEAEILIREAVPTDWAPAVKMIWSVFIQDGGRTCSAEGVETFFEFLSSDRLHQMFLRGEYKMLLAEAEGRILGVITLRDGNLLSLLFIRNEYQGSGIGSSLIRKLCEELGTCGIRELVVKAAPEAVGFYEKCGFVTCQTMVETRGIRTVEMKKTW